MKELTGDEWRRTVTDPAAVYASAQDVLDDERLTRDQKIEVLRHWEFDVRDLDVAVEENMGGGSNVPLESVLEALRSLGADSRPVNDASEKHGG